MNGPFVHCHNEWNERIFVDSAVRGVQYGINGLGFCMLISMSGSEGVGLIALNQARGSISCYERSHGGLFIAMSEARVSVYCSLTPMYWSKEYIMFFTLF